MIGALRDEAARRAALRVVRQRRAQPWRDRLDARRVLAVLPSDEAELRAAWAFVRQLGLPRALLTPVLLGEGVPYVPDAYLGTVQLVDKKARDWRGLPRASVAQALWSTDPDLAMDLTTTFDLAAAALVGGSPAHLRLGFHTDGAEPFYDFMVAPAESPVADYGGALHALRRYLAALYPPALAL